MPTGISVVICCFNSATRIKPTLKHLYKQKGISSFLWEVILVNNGSADNTSEVAINVWDSFIMEKPKFKIVDEPTPGLSFARQKGINESYFDYILFCDDDNWLDEDYLIVALNSMQEDPSIGALGGTGYPVFEKKETPYFWVNQYHALAVGIQSEIDGDITDERGVLYGAGMIVNKLAYKNLIENFQFEFQISDRIGNTLLSSGDHELCLALKKIGFKIHYSKSLTFKHYIPGYRTTIKYYKRLFLGFGMSNAMLSIYYVNKGSLNNIKNDYRYIAMRCLKNIVFTSAFLLRKGYFFNKNNYKYLDNVHCLYSNMGHLKAIIKIKNLYKTQFSRYPLFKQ